MRLNCYYLGNFLLAKILFYTIVSISGRIIQKPIAIAAFPSKQLQMKLFQSWDLYWSVMLFSHALHLTQTPAVLIYWYFRNKRKGQSRKPWSNKKRKNTEILYFFKRCAKWKRFENEAYKRKILGKKKKSQNEHRNSEMSWQGRKICRVPK